MKTLPQTLSMRIETLLETGRFKSPEALLDHALDIVETAEDDIKQARSELSALLEQRLRTDAVSEESISLAAIKDRYARSG